MKVPTDVFTYFNGKPHIRLHYCDSANFQWWVEYVAGPSQRVRRQTFRHTTSQGALTSARTLWFKPWDARRYAKS